MSNSSSNAVRKDDGPSHEDLLTQLLGGIAQECSAIGTAISRVGDGLSGALTDADMSRVMLECQAFDRLSQIAHAQARLIEHVGRLLLNGTAASSADLITAIGDVPTYDVRQRLCAAIGLPQDGSAGETPPEDDVFF